MMKTTLPSLVRLVLLAACMLAAPTVRAQDATTGAARASTSEGFVPPTVCPCR